VQGRSAVSHELDVIAEKPRTRGLIAFECKSTSVGRNDIFTFAGKLRDIGIPEGIMVTTEEEVNRDVLSLAKCNSIRIIPSALDKPQKEWDKLLATT
jgi:hypothetical protein